MYVRVDLRPSRMLRLARIALHAIALVSVMWVDLNFTALLAIGALVTANFLRVMRAPQRVPDAILFIDGIPRLLYRDHVMDVDLQEQYYCTTFLLMLHFKEKPLLSRERDMAGEWFFLPPRPVRNDFRIVILPDSTNARSHRRLRMLLRWHKVHVQFRNRQPRVL